MLRLLMKVDTVYHCPSLDSAVEDGILARENKIKSGEGRRDNNSARKKEEENDRMWLTASGKRLQSMLAWAEQNS